MTQVQQDQKDKVPTNVSCMPSMSVKSGFWSGMRRSISAAVCRHFDGLAAGLLTLPHCPLTDFNCDLGFRLSSGPRRDACLSCRHRIDLLGVHWRDPGAFNRFALVVHSLFAVAWPVLISRQHCNHGMVSAWPCSSLDRWPFICADACWGSVD